MTTGVHRVLPGPVRRLIADTARAWTDGGVKVVAREWREALEFPLFRRGSGTVIEQDLSYFNPVPVPQGVTVEVREAGADMSDFASIANQRVVRSFLRCLARGRTCIAALRGARVIGYTWVSVEMSGDLELYPVRLPADAVYGWKLFVLPGERSGGVGSSLVSARLQLARDRGFRKMWRVIDRKNIPSVRTVQKTWGKGSRVVGEIAFVKIFRWSFGRTRPPSTRAIDVSANRAHREEEAKAQ
jgi:GNAT superfamily N-acetyltransferase